MKLLTLNLHNLPLTFRKEHMDAFAKAIAELRPNVIALQEVFAVDSEKGNASPAEHPPENESPLAPLLDYLALYGMHYHGVWKPIKIGYGTYREGVAILSDSPVTEEFFLTVSDTEDENDWKKRGILGISVENYPDELFFSVHYGWWGDADEPFARQWTKTARFLSPLREKRQIWLMGDFNNPAHRRGEGYDLLTKDGWQDAYLAAPHREGEITVSGAIDGWQGDASGKRIDFIFASRPVRIKCAKTVLDGVRHPVVSDHYGLWVECGEVDS